MRAIDRDLIRAGHYGQRPGVPHSKAEHMAAPTKAANVKKVLANSEPSTHGTKRTFLFAPPMSAFGVKRTSLLAISQTQDVRDDAVSIIIFDHEVWHCPVRGVQRSSKRSGCHSWSVGNPCESWRLFICRLAILLYG